MLRFILFYGHFGMESVPDPFHVSFLFFGYVLGANSTYPVANKIGFFVSDNMCGRVCQFGMTGPTLCTTKALGHLLKAMYRKLGLIQQHEWTNPGHTQGDVSILEQD